MIDAWDTNYRLNGVLTLESVVAPVAEVTQAMIDAWDTNETLNGGVAVIILEQVLLYYRCRDFYN